MKLKGLTERRNSLADKMQGLLDKAKAEKRNLTSDEVREFDECENEINSLDEKIKAEERKNNMDEKKTKQDGSLTPEERDIQAFAAYIRAQVTGVETRAETKLTKGDNGAVIPTTIIKKIIEKVEEISPVCKLATKYDVKGTAIIPKEDGTSDSITVIYANEFEELVSHSNKFATIELKGFLYGALTKVSKSLLKNSDFKLVEWVVNKMARNIAIFQEHEALKGTSNKALGVDGSYDKENMTITFASASKITADELIDIQELVPDVFQSNCIWIMNKKTRTAIRKLKDGQGNYLLEKDSTARWGRKLLNADVYVTNNVKGIGTENENVIYYGDFSGLAIKESEEYEIQILLEKFATQHAIGVVAWGEIDAQVEDTQKIAVGKTPAAAPVE